MLSAMTTLVDARFSDGPRRATGPKGDVMAKTTISARQAAIEVLKAAGEPLKLT